MSRNENIKERKKNSCFQTFTPFLMFFFKNVFSFPTSKRNSIIVSVHGTKWVLKIANKISFLKRNMAVK